MAWTTKTGVNLRATTVFVTDPSGSVCLPDDGGTGNNPLYTPGAHSNSPLTVNGNTFNVGWTSNVDGARDRSTSVDARLAGRQGASANTFELQCGASAGLYKIWLGISDQTNGSSGAVSCQVSDANGVLFTATSVAALSTTGVVDAQSVLYASDTAWAATADTSGTAQIVSTTDTSNGNGGPLLQFLINANTPLAHVAVQQITQPLITAQPKSQQVQQDYALTFAVTALSSGGSLTYQWQDNRSGSFVNCIDGSGATTATYVTGPLPLGASGRLYQCVVTDSNGSTTSNSASVLVIPYLQAPFTPRPRSNSGGTNFGLDSGEWW